MTQGNSPESQNRESRRAAGQRGARARAVAKKPAAETVSGNQRLILSVIWGITGLTLAGLVLWVLLNTLLRSQPGDVLADLGHEHIPSVDAVHRPYNSSPSTSGPHVDGVTDIGIYEEQLPEPLQVALLEDGYVLVQYDCPTPCQVLLDDLTLAVGPFMQDGKKVVLAPYAGIKDVNGQSRKVALTAWTRLQTLDTGDAKAVGAFIRAYEGVSHREGETPGL